jgi:uncharacterized protein with HEPN domain
VPPTLADRVGHILQAIGGIERLLAGQTYEDFASNEFLLAAAERFLERISEASRHIPADVKANEPNIAWQKMADFGNRLRHAYHGVDPKVVWDIAQDDLDPLRVFVEAILHDKSS